MRLQPVTFLKAMWRVILHIGRTRSFSLRVPDKVLANRIVACQVDCDLYEPGSGQCPVCSCYLSLKAPLVTEDCPHPTKNYWNEKEKSR